MNISDRVMDKPLHQRAVTWVSMRSATEKAIAAVICVVLLYAVFFRGEAELTNCPTQPLQIFVMVGQKEMLGHARYSTLRSLDGIEPYNTDLWDEDSSFREYPVRVISSEPNRNDRYGNLTIGYGADALSIGPELGFGIQMHKKMNAPILIYKFAWDGHETLEEFHDHEGTHNMWRRFDHELKEKLSSDNVVLSHYFPDWNPASGVQVRGVVMYHGFNDFHWQAAHTNYQANVVDFVDDMDSVFKLLHNERANAAVPEDVNIDIGDEDTKEDLVYLSGELPYLGIETKQHAVTEFRKMQHATLDKFPKMKDKLSIVELAHLWDTNAEKLARAVLLEPDNLQALTAFEKVGSGDEKDYYNSGKMTYDVGVAFADAMIARLKKQDSPTNYCYFKK